MDKNLKEEILNLRSVIEFSDLETIYNSKELKFFGKNNQTKNPFEIIVGKLGNIFLLTALVGILATKPNFISEIFENFTYNSQGIYGVRLIQQGELKLILVDDNFPVLDKQNTPAFSYTKKEIWLPILEKGLAKLNGKCIAKSLYGTPYEAFNTISFAPSYFFMHKKFIKKNRSDVIWLKILDACAKKYAICASTEEIVDCVDCTGGDKRSAVGDANSNDKDVSSFMGNQSNFSHAQLNVNDQGIRDLNSPYMIDKNLSFTVLEAHEYEDNKILKIWNPKYDELPEWQGQFSHESEEWSLEMEEYVKYENAPGIFYPTFDEFLKYFSWTYICKIEENFLYRSLKSKEFFNNENKKNNDKYYIDNLGNVNFEKLNINNDNDNDKSKSKSKTEGENYNCNFF